MKFHFAFLLCLLLGCAGAPRESDTPVEKSTSGNGGKIVGAVGASGVTGDQDEQCSKAGLAAM